MRNYLRYFRIGWTAFCAIVAVLLLVLWVRSCWWHDIIVWTSGARSFVVQSDEGKLRIDLANDGIFMPLGWSRVSFPVSDDDLMPDDDPASEEELKTVLGFGWQTEKGSLTAAVPFWFQVLACGAVIAVPWLPHKGFSLRTLLIAIAVIAVVLGLVLSFDRMNTVLWAGRYPLEVTLTNTTDEGIGAVAVALLDRTDYADKLTNESSWRDLNFAEVDWIEGEPFVVSVPVSGRRSAFGRELNWFQKRLLVVRRQYADGRENLAFAEIPDLRVTRELTVSASDRPIQKPQK